MQAQRDIDDILARRAMQEQLAAHNHQQATVAQQHGAALTEHDAHLGGGVSAVQAHQAAVARKQQANQKQQADQASAKGSVEQYADRKAGLEALRAPLGVWRQATGVVMGADWLPDDVTAKMRQMNGDAERFERQLAALDAQMMRQIAAQGPAVAKLATDKSSIDAVGQQNAGAQQQMAGAKASLDATKQANSAQQTKANEAKNAATARSNQLANEASQKKAHHDSLAAQLVAWAEAHRAARTKALQDKKQMVEGQGLMVTSVRER